MSSILNLNQVNNTLAAKQVDTVRYIQNIADSLYRQMCHYQKDGILTVWNNPAGLTPQQVCDAMGSEASKTFAFHSSLTDAIVEIAQTAGIQPDILTPTFNFTINSDGTVTVLSTPYGS